MRAVRPYHDEVRPSGDELPAVVLLDLDDTIVSFSVGKRNFWEDAYQRHAPATLSITLQAFAEAIASASTEYWSEPLRAHRGRLDLRKARHQVALLALKRLSIEAGPWAQALADCFTELKEAAVAPFPGAVAALEELRSRGVRLGLVTNGSSEFQRRKLRDHGLERFFETIVIEGELGIGKPSPEAFERALAALDARPEDAWMVGDNLEADIAGANALGIYAVWHNPMGIDVPSASPGRPDRVIAHLRELIAPRLASVPG